jgi:hypothetical protein
MCSHGERVVRRLRECHISLIQEVAQCHAMVETKVEKLKAKMETEEAERCQLVVEVEVEVTKLRANMECETAALRKEIEIWEIKYKASKKIYKTLIVCTWILIIVYLLWLDQNRKVCSIPDVIVCYYHEDDGAFV